MKLDKYLIVMIIMMLNSYLTYSYTAEEIIGKVKENLEKIEKFEADISINIELENVNVPERRGKIFFQKPDSTRYEIEGFSMMPKAGMGNYIAELLNLEATLINSGEELINGNSTIIIKIIPNDNKSDVVLSTLWIDKMDYTVIKSEITTKNNGTFEVESEYQLFENKYYLPISSIISFQVPKYKMPKAFTGDTRKQKEDKNPKSNTSRGKVNIKYNNYIIN